jgi:UDP-N-acetylmuramate--alanine ligase
MMKERTENKILGEDNISKAGISAAREVPRSIYFIGIGGIGMSALARYFKTQGVNVSGYDKTSTMLTRQLEAEGIAIHYVEDVASVPREVELVVYTPAIPAGHAELQFYQNNNYKVVKRSDALKIITESSFNICVAGTHGKTTVSTMIAHILRHSGFGCNAFLGGISSNYLTNFWSNERNVCVIEADEYDRSFLKLSPDVAVITAMDPDHLDIYGTAEEFEKAFVAFSRQVKQGGRLLLKSGLGRTNEFKPANRLEYSLNDDGADVYATGTRIENGSYIFDVVSDEWQLKEVKLHMGGLHNVENMVAAMAVAKLLKIDDEKIKEAVAEFKGVRRRFEYVVKNEQHVLIDDYAHHPEELRALIGGVRSLFKQKLVMVFQPHLYSRTKDQADGFAEVLDLCDQVILLPIYPARELPLKGVSSEMILEKMKLAERTVLQKEELKDWVQENRPALLVMAGAGDIDTLIQEVKRLFEL